MRFRLGINSAGATDAGAGVSNAFRTLSMLPLMQAQAADEGQRMQAEAEMRAAQQRQADAHAALFNTQAEEKRTEMQRGSLPELIATAARMNKVSPDQIPEVQQYFQTGQLAGKYDLPGNLPGPVLPKPEYADTNGLGGQILRSLGLTQQALTLGEKNVEHVADATGKYQKQDDVRRVQADPGAAGRVGQSYAAVDGKPLIDNIGNSGRGFNQFTGDGMTLDPGMAVLFDQGEKAQIGQRNASAASSYASAAHSNALTAKTKQELEQGQRTGNLQVVTGQDGTVTIVDKVNRTAQPVLGADGKPVVKGAAGGGGKAMTEGQAKANIYGGRMMESDAVLSQMENSGVYRPGTIKSLSEGVASAVPLIGDKLAEGAGAATNWTQSPKQQQVDQARRDFINAVLRRESGAAISPSEFANADKQYFPQMGDSKEVLAQKRRNRQIATNLMLQEVPEGQRYRLGSGYGGAPGAAPAAPQSGGASGSWGAAPSGRTVKVDY